MESDTSPNDERRLGKYRIVARLGSGGMGIVFQAEDVTLGRSVAIKILSHQLGKDGDALQRFQQEARATARLNHPHVVQIYEIAQFREEHFLVMELVDGGSASARVHENGPFPWREATAIIRDACKGLVAAHAAGMLHRDIKPGNILLTREGVAKLADFGLAKFHQHNADSLTPLGNVVGTPDYMSPEQCRCESLDERSDLYALGASYYNLLTGRPPFEGDTCLQIMFAHCSTPVPDPRVVNPGIPVQCTAIVARAMSKSREDRYDTAAAMLRDLEAAFATGNGADLFLDSSASGKADSFTATTRGIALPQEPQQGKRRRAWIGLMGLLLLLIPAGIVWLFNSNKDLNREKEKERPAPRPIQLRFRKTLEGHTGEVRCVRVSNDERLLASAGGEGDVRLWRLPQGTPFHVLKGHKGQVLSVAISPDRSTVASGGEDRTLRLWDVETGQERAKVEGIQGNVYDVAFSPDGKYLLIGLGYGGWVLREFTSPKSTVLVAQRATEDFLAQIAFSPDGRQFATIDSGKAVRIWSTSDAREVSRLPLEERFSAVTFTPDGKSLILGTFRGSVKRWSPTEDRLKLLMDRVEKVSSLLFTPDEGNLLCSGAYDGAIRLYHVATGETKVFRENAEAVPVRSMAFGERGRLLVTGHEKNGFVKLWDVEPVDP